MFHAMSYKSGWVQFNEVGLTTSIYAQFWRDGEYKSVKANSLSHAKRLITLNEKRG